MYGTDLNNAYDIGFNNNKVSTPISLLPPPPPSSTPISLLPPPPLLQQEHVTAPTPQPQPQPQPKSQSKREVLRILNYSFIILFALGLYSFFELVIKENVISNDLSYKQEIGLRLAYPILLFIGLLGLKYII